jgi:hypothetical protein
MNNAEIEVLAQSLIDSEIPMRLSVNAILSEKGGNFQISKFLISNDV